MILRSAALRVVTLTTQNTEICIQLWAPKILIEIKRFWLYFATNQAYIMLTILVIFDIMASMRALQGLSVWVIH